MCDRCIQRLLLLKEEVNVVLLNNKRQMEVGNMKRQILGVEHAKHVDLLGNLLDAALQLADSLLLLRILLQNVLQNLATDTNLLIQMNILECRRQEEVLRNSNLLRLGVALQLQNHHAIQ